MKLLNISSKIPFLEEVNSAECGDIRFILMDTMGVNEADDVIEAGTLEILSQADVLVYLFDISKLSSRDELLYFSQIVSQRPDIVKEGRAFFLLNKKDLIAGNPDQTINEAKQLIQRFLGNISAELAQAASRIYPVSTESFYLAKGAQSGTLSPDEHAKLVKNLCGRRANPNEVDFSDDRWAGDLQEEIDYSGYGPIEDALRRELTLNAPRMFATAIIGKMARIVNSVHQQLQTRLQAFSISKQNTETAIRGLQQAIQGANTFQEDVERIISSSRREIMQILRPVLDTTEAELRNAISCPSDKEHDTKEVTESEERTCLRNTHTGFRLCVSKIQAVMKSSVTPQIAKICQSVDRCREETIRVAVVNSLAGILSADELHRLEQALRVDMQWDDSTTVRNLEVELNYQSTTNSIMTEVSEERPHLVEAIYGTRERTVGTPAPGPSVLEGATGGAGIGAAFGGIGALVGGALGAVASLFGSRKKTTSTYQEQYVIQPAKLEYRTETVEKEKWKNNVQEYQRQMEQVVTHLATEKNTYPKSWKPFDER